MAKAGGRDESTVVRPAARTFEGRNGIASLAGTPRMACLFSPNRAAPTPSLRVNDPVLKLGRLFIVEAVRRCVTSHVAERAAVAVEDTRP